MAAVTVRLISTSLRRKQKSGAITASVPQIKQKVAVTEMTRPQSMDKTEYSLRPVVFTYGRKRAKMRAADAISPPLAMIDSAKTGFPSPQSPPTTDGEKRYDAGPHELGSDARPMERTAAAVVSIDDLLVHQELVFRICLGHSKNYAEAEDLMQDVYLKAHESLAGLREPGHAREWLLRITRNTCLDFGKAMRLRAILLRRWGRGPEATTGGPSGRTENTDDRLARLKSAVGRLPRKLRDVFVLREYGHLSYDELGAALSIKKGTVMSRLNRARARLAATLKETTDERP